MRRTFKITPTSRANIPGFVAELISHALDGMYVDVKVRRATRSLEQNNRMWSMLDDIRDARIPWRDWQGREMFLSSDGWKQVFLASLQGQTLVPGLNGELVVLEGGRSSTLEVPQMSDLMTLIEMFAAERGIPLRVHQ